MTTLKAIQMASPVFGIERREIDEENMLHGQTR